jgi:signal transduction histidine kinase
MAFRRAIWAGFSAAALVVIGALGVLAWRAHLWACVLVLGLFALWAMARAVWSEATRQRPAPVAAPPPPSGDAGVQLQLVRTLLDHTPAPLVTVAHDGILRAGNRAARRLFKTDDRLIDPPPDLAAALTQTDPGRRLTVALQTAEGPHAYAVSIADLIDARGPTRLAALIDIQPEIRAAEAAATRDLLQVLSHEIMNALTPVASLAATAKDILDETDAAPLAQARDAVATLARRAEGLTRFVEAYRSLSRLPEPCLAPVSATALLDEAAQLFRGRWDRRGVALTVARPHPDIILDLDRDLMVHALANILSNGAEAALETRPGAATVSLGVDMEEGRARIMIRDNGPGVDPVHAETIFQPFFTTKPHGSGIGLSFASQVAASHGGRLTLAPHPAGGGAVFVLTL